MEDLCTACLCVGRNLFFIGETGCYTLYYQILNEVEVVSDGAETVGCARICWECRAVMCRFQRFKARAQRCYAQLMGRLQNGATKLSSEDSNLGIQHVVNISYPEVPVKCESGDELVPENVKSETVDSEAEQHCEPETFVRDLTLGHPEAKKKGTVKKTSRKRIKKKVKKKKPAKLKAKDISDSEPWLDECAEKEEEDVKKEEEKLREEKIATDDCDTEIELEPRIVNTVEAKKPVASGVGERPQCVECGKMFSSKKTYRYHLNVLHKGQNRYPCPRCGKVYQWKSNLGRHMRSHKARDSGELRCSPCGKLFASVATFRQHLRVSRRHVPEADFGFTCDECGKKFVNKTRLRDHIDWEHLKKIKFRCQLCNKPYKCHTSLYVHTQNVHRERHSRDNLCHVCGKSYQNGAKLKYHIVAMHTSETPYQCERCSAAFGWYSSLYRHVREVHYKMKVQPKKSKRAKKLAGDGLAALLPAHEAPHPGPA
ncbi:unnamed protein product, partial [Iphiclides podalirius]